MACSSVLRITVNLSWRLVCLEQCLGVIRGKNATVSASHTWVELACVLSFQPEGSSINFGALILSSPESVTFFFLFTFLRLIQDVQTFIENLGQDCAANITIEE